MTATLEMFCLGQFELLSQHKGQSQRLSKPPTLKSQSLLAYLIYYRQRPHTRDKLTGMFWGDRPHKRARRSLSNALTHIRRCFAPGDPLQADNQLVQAVFLETVWLDAEAFVAEASQHDLKSLQTAVARYRGEFLAGFYDDWVIDERYRLQALYLESLARLMTLYETQSQFQPALEIAWQLLKEDALREDAHRLLMRAYCHLGKRNAALAQYQQCRETVFQELGVPPTDETTELYERIRDGRFTTAPISKTLSVTFPAALSSPQAGLNPLDAASVTPLVEREKELAFLGSCWSQAQSGPVKVVFVRGEAGVGKSHLVETFSHNIRGQGGRLLWGRCYEFERLLPYQPLIESLRPWLSNVDVTHLSHLPPWVVAEMAWLMPDLLSESKLPDTVTRYQPQPGSAGDSQTHPRLFQAITYLLAMLADRPLLLVLEDLHWATESTLQLLHYLARNLTHRPVLLLGTYRQELVGRNHPVVRLARQLSQENLAQALTLARLSLTAVETLVAQMSAAGPAILPLARQLFQETEGNPFFLLETIKALFEQGVIELVDGIWSGEFDQINIGELPIPASINEAILARTQRLAAETQAGLHLATVLGREFDYDLLNTVWDQGEEATLALLDDLLRSRLISEGQGKTERDYLFTHHKIREVIYAALPARRRQHLHAQVGQVMESLYADQRESVVAELAHHFDQGRRVKRSLRDKAAAYLQQAGRQAAAQFANREALAYFNRAGALLAENNLPGRYDLLLSRVKVYDILGERPSQHDDLHTLAAIAKALANERRQAEIAQLQSHYYFMIADYPAAISASQTAVKLANRCGAAGLQARGQQLWGEALWAQGEYGAAQTQLEQAIQLAQAAGDKQIEADSRRSLGMVYLHQGEYAQAEAMLEQALTIFRQPPGRSWQGEAQTLRTLGNLRRNQGAYAAAQQNYELTLQLNQQMGDRYNEAITYNNLGVICWDQSDFATAETHFLKCLEISREIDDLAGVGFVLNNLGRLAGERGHLAQAQTYLQDALQIHHRLGEPRREAFVFQSLAYILREQGAYQAALDRWQQTLAIRRKIGDRRGEGYALRGLAETALLQGDFAQVEDHLRLALAIFQEIGEQRGTGEALRGLGMLATRLGDYPAAIDHFHQAQTFLDSRRDNAYTLLHMSLLYHQLEDDETAVNHIQESLQTAQELDIHLLWAAALTYAGHIHLALDHLTEAAQAYEQALALRRSTRQHHLTIEPLAGLSQVHWQQGNKAEALNQLEEVWHYFEQNGRDGAEHSLRVYYICFQLWQADQAGRVTTILKSAYDHLQMQAATIPTEGRRRSFLEQVPIHRDLVSASLRLF